MVEYLLTVVDIGSMAKIFAFIASGIFIKSVFSKSRKEYIKSARSHEDIGDRKSAITECIETRYTHGIAGGFLLLSCIFDFLNTIYKNTYSSDQIVTGSIIGVIISIILLLAVSKYKKSDLEKTLKEQKC